MRDSTVQEPRTHVFAQPAFTCCGIQMLLQGFTASCTSNGKTETCVPQMNIDHAAFAVLQIAAPSAVSQLWA